MDYLLAYLEHVLIDAGEDFQDKRGIFGRPLLHTTMLADRAQAQDGRWGRWRQSGRVKITSTLSDS